METGTAADKADGPDPQHRRPEDADDTAVAAAGKLSEALEYTERARGLLYAFHQLTGHADFLLDEVVRLLHAGGHRELADEVQDGLIGRNVLAGRWTFQIVEEYDDGYYREFRETERRVRDRLMEGRRHVYEAELKERRRTHGRPGHRARP
ncbi:MULTISPECIES: hypothetical protein [Streptomyces]|uniref:hypothetical protein n=1 Tax=Streptomyces TaxID=1883 RepID=UPI0003085F23|nr:MULTISPECIES: hypothetical protein [Streptomyces]MCC5037111.1 hypothetical protein [Streptomyces sp. WAC 00631]MCC9737715.1 hypothetical protein [Streptomyces sp. MNU89]MZE79614.1 hypothetical protein [Streptomyces sp. SID5475]